MITQTVLIDTGPIVALLSHRDAYHIRCVEQARQLPHTLYTCWPVITEAAHILRNTPSAVDGLLERITVGSLKLLPLTELDTEPNAEDGFINGDGKKYLIMDRDDKVCDSFRRVLQDENIQPLRLPPQSPNLNAHLERFFGSLKSECVDRMIFFGEQSLPTAVREYLLHYHGERNHQGLGNKIPMPAADLNQTIGPIECRNRLGGQLRYYHRRAA